MNTLPALLLDRASRTPTETAIRHHTLGIWESRSWSELLQQVAIAGNALSALGVRDGDVVALVSANRPEWIIADLAIQGLGARTLALHPNFSPTTVSRLVGEHEAVVAIVSDQEQYDKLEPSRGQLPSLRTIVVINSRGIRTVDQHVSASDSSVNWNAFVGLGAGTDSWTARASALREDSPVTIEFVVTPTPNGPASVTSVTRTSAELLSASESLGAQLDAHGGDELLPIASFAEPIERSISEVLALRLGATINIGEGGELQGLELAAVQPTIVHVPADALRKMYADIAARKPKRGIRTIALNRILAGSGSTSRSAHTDLRITRIALVGLVVATILIHRLLVSVTGWIRLGLIAAMWIAVLGGLIIGGQAVRPFIRRAYGLANARSLLTGSGLDTPTADFFGALQLRPITEHTIEHRTDALNQPDQTIRGGRS
jgi:long-subunit acyl-CoA synthetase (AMP-forming)